MYVYILLYHPIPSHISLYYHVLSYIPQTSLGPSATEWNGPDFGKRSMSWNGTEHYFMERIIFVTAQNGSSLAYAVGPARSPEDLVPLRLGFPAAIGLEAGRFIAVRRSNEKSWGPY